MTWSRRVDQRNDPWVPTLLEAGYSATCEDDVDRLNERIALKATVEPKVTRPESRLYGQVNNFLVADHAFPMRIGHNKCEMAIKPIA